MVKKLLVLLTLGVFLVGAFGGCYTYGIPDLSGYWHGELISDKVPGVNIRITINNLTQDSSGNFTGGTVTVTYNFPTTSYTLTAYVTEGNTDELRARIKARNAIGIGETQNLVALILLIMGSTVTIQQGDSYEFAFTFPHLYGCVDGTLSDMTGDYEFKLYTQSAPLGQVFDKGTAHIER